MPSSRHTALHDTPWLVRSPGLSGVALALMLAGIWTAGAPGPARADGRVECRSPSGIDDLGAARAAFAEACPDVARRDCDPLPGEGWVCSSHVIGANAPPSTGWPGTPASMIVRPAPVAVPVIAPVIAPVVAPVVAPAPVVPPGPTAGPVPVARLPIPGAPVVPVVPAPAPAPAPVPAPVVTPEPVPVAEPSPAPAPTPEPEPLEAAAPGAPPATWPTFDADLAWSLQLQGELDLDGAIDVQVVDLFDRGEDGTIERIRASGGASVCYFSAGTWENWRPDVGQLDPSAIGATLLDWPNERFLDVRRPDVVELMVSRIDRAAQAGCDAVDPDNVDSWTHDTGFGLTRADAVGYLRTLSTAAHERGLAIGLKNALSLVPAVGGEFDFAINESCQVFDECGAYAPMVRAGKLVMNAEYVEYHPGSATDVGVLAEVCRRGAEAGVSTTLYSRALDGGFRRDCP